MLDSSYDLTAAQADACIDYIYNNVASGIASGYLYKVEDEKKEEAADDPKGNDDKAPEDGKKPQDKAPDKDIGADKKIVDVGKDAKADKTKEEMACVIDRPCSFPTAANIIRSGCGSSAARPLWRIQKWPTG